MCSGRSTTSVRSSTSTSAQDTTLWQRPGSCGRRSRPRARAPTASTDRAAIYSPALQVVLLDVGHVTGKAVQQVVERDHQHMKGRYR